METKRIIIEDRNHIKDEELKEAARILRSGGLVAFPTETVYVWAAMHWTRTRQEKFMPQKGGPLIIL